MCMTCVFVGVGGDCLVCVHMIIFLRLPLCVSTSAHVLLLMCVCVCVCAFNSPATPELRPDVCGCVCVCACAHD